VDIDGDGEADESEEREVNYHNPALIWLKDRPDEKSEFFAFSESQGGVSNIDKETEGGDNVKEDDADESDPSFEVMEKPEIKNAAGNWIKLGEDGEEGLVDKVIASTGVMKVIFDSAGLDATHVPLSEINYDNPDIVWIKYNDDDDDEE